MPKTLTIYFDPKSKKICKVKRQSKISILFRKFIKDLKKPSKISYNPNYISPYYSITKCIEDCELEIGKEATELRKMYLPAKEAGKDLDNYEKLKLQMKRQEMWHKEMRFREILIETPNITPEGLERLLKRYNQ